VGAFNACVTGISGVSYFIVVKKVAEGVEGWFTPLNLTRIFALNCYTDWFETLER
jgi:hypothetical protein